MTEPMSMADRWTADEDEDAATLPVLAPPRWQRDNLSGYASDGADPSLDEIRSMAADDSDDDEIERAIADEPDPTVAQLMEWAAEADELERAAGMDVTLGHERLHFYWTKGAGLKRWITSRHQWTKLKRLLEKHVGPERAKRFAAKWVHEVTGFWPGSDAHRVEEGGKPRGHRIGPG